MKLSALIFSLLFGSQALADAFKCIDVAERAAARYDRISLREFRNLVQFKYLCRPKTAPSTERIYFGDGSAFTAVWLIAIDDECIVTDIFVGQDDQDFDYSECQ